MKKGNKKNNPWLDHVKRCRAMKKNKGKPLKDVLKDAKKSYKK